MDFKSILLLSAMVYGSVYAQDLPGFHPTYQSALETSRKDDKILMIDFYTSWCGPCKKLDKEVYGADDFLMYTQKLACVKVDFETEEGAKLGKQYDVSSFPSVLFIDTNGNEIERITSYFAKDRYMKDVDRIVEGKNTIGAIEKNFPHQTSYSDLFRLSAYFGRRYYNAEKRDRYHEALLKLDPEMKQDSTLMLTNVLYQSQMMRNDVKNPDAMIAFIMNYPTQPYQAELMLRVVKYLINNNQQLEAREVYLDFSSKFDTKGDKDAEKYLKEAKKITK